MKSFALCALAGLATAVDWKSNLLMGNYLSEEQIDEPITTTMRRNGFGAIVEQNVYANNRTETTIKAPLVPWTVDFAQHTEFIEEASRFHREHKEGTRKAPQYTCANRNPYGDDTTGLSLLPAFAGTLNASNPTFTFKGHCFDNITMTYQETSPTTFDIVIDNENQSNGLCSETLMIANTEITHIELLFLKGQHTLHFEMKDQESQEDMQISGLQVFDFCESAVHEIESLWNTLKMFVGGLSDHPDWPVIGSHVPKYQEEANVKFIKDALNVELEPRETTNVEIDPSLIQSGDFFGVMRLDGLDQIIMYGTGAYIGHNVMALRMEDDELYIVESQDAWYWPTAGLQRTKWADWIKQADEASFHVTWHRMRDEVRAKFDVQKAIDFFNETKGMPYGYHNFLYGWIDTPEDNWPPLLPVNFVPIMFNIVQMIAPDVVYDFFSQALNKRLGTDGLNIQGLVDAAFQQGMKIDEVMAMVEKDGWRYDGDGYDNSFSYVCSAYVAAIFKAGGLFGDYDVNATEFATKDVYILNFWDETTPLPEACTTADPSLPYCQLLGKYRINLPSYNTVDPYPNMFETCKINYPTYERDPGC